MRERAAYVCICVPCTILFRMVCGDVCMCAVDAHHVSTTIKVTVLGGCTLINYERDISRGSPELEREKRGVVVEKSSVLQRGMS
jgi:hypothetical protein